MYGLLLENISDYIKQEWGEEKWEEIRRATGINTPSFSVHQSYPENFIPRLARQACKILGKTEQDFMRGMGRYFVNFVGQYGYDRMLSVLGRHLRDFLNGLDNLHEYLKFSYPRMRAPSFFVENETRRGLTLHYRSKRRGYVYYTMGQIEQVALHFYDTKIHIDLIKEEVVFDTVHVTFQLDFDNKGFMAEDPSLTLYRDEKLIPIQAHVFLDIFPFCLVFASDMIVRNVGRSLLTICPHFVGSKITEHFDLVKPLVEFKFNTILNRRNNIFELVTTEPIQIDYDDGKRLNKPGFDDTTPVEEAALQLKGQMLYMDEWRMILYLATPVMPDLDHMIQAGLYINDLSMHDFSRDLMLAGTQQSVELKLALDQEQQKSKKLEESMRKLDEEMKRTDELLYQMIPKMVADRLRNGENPVDTCQVFDSVTILFSDVVGFTSICSRIAPLEVVSMLNGMYSLFDALTEKNRVYKVETIGDAYMVVAGAPEVVTDHAQKICDMALDMVDAIVHLMDSSTGEHLKIRVGIHSGTVVAGVVGMKMPRYCLFGDTVNTASRMESNSEAMKIHISETTRQQLPDIYEVTKRGEVEVKGKGKMETFWLLGCQRRKPITEDEKARLMASSDNESTNFFRSELDSRRSMYSPVTYNGVRRGSMSAPTSRAGTAVSRASVGGGNSGIPPGAGGIILTPSSMNTNLTQVRPTSSGIRLPGRPGSGGAIIPGLGLKAIGDSRPRSASASGVPSIGRPSICAFPGPIPTIIQKVGPATASRYGRTEIGVQVDLGSTQHPEAVTIQLFPSDGGDQPKFVPCILPKGYATSVGAVLYPYDESAPMAALVPLESINTGTGKTSTCCTGKKHHYQHRHNKHKHYNVNGQDRSMQHVSHDREAPASRTCIIL